jgi:hypothetical protein
MKIRTLVLLLLPGLTIGCGGGKTNTPAPNFANVAGSWKIVLSENQASIVAAAKSPSASIDPNPTEIAVVLTQSSGILSSSSGIYLGNTGCDTSSSWWYNTGPYNGAWDSVTYGFNFGSGQVSENTVTLTLAEAMSFQGGQPVGSSGTLTLLGTVQSDGTISGTLTDSCVLDATGKPTNQTFAAAKIVTFPPTVWP